MYDSADLGKDSDDVEQDVCDSGELGQDLCDLGRFLKFSGFGPAFVILGMLFVIVMISVRILLIWVTSQRIL